jgi:hypothetical protein
MDTFLELRRERGLHPLDVIGDLISERAMSEL